MLHYQEFDFWYITPSQMGEWGKKKKSPPNVSIQSARWYPTLSSLCSNETFQKISYMVPNTNCIRTLFLLTLELKKTELTSY